VVTLGASTTTPSTVLAATGFNLERDVKIGATMIAGGWALNRWASSRTPNPLAAADGGSVETGPDQGDPLQASGSDEDSPQ
jgi:hypothetical protein